MAYVTHSVANHTQGTRTKEIHTIIGGRSVKRKFFVPSWDKITSGSKIGNFREQDYVRSLGHAGNQITYYSESKMTYLEATNKAAQAEVSMTITQSIIANGTIQEGGTIGYTKSPAGNTWSNHQLSATTDNTGEIKPNQMIISHSADASVGAWALSRAYMAFDMSKWGKNRNFTKAVIRVYTSQSTAVLSDAFGWYVKPFLWKSTEIIGPFDAASFNDFDTDYQSTTATVLSSSGDGNEYGEIVIDGTLLEWMNTNPNGLNASVGKANEGMMGICLRGLYDYNEDNADGPDPSGKNVICLVTGSETGQAPELYYEFTSSEVPNLGGVKDRDGSILSGTSSIRIEGIHTSSFRDPAVIYEKEKWNHNNSASILSSGAYSNNFLTQASESMSWQFCYSQSYKADGTKIDDHNSELVLVGKNGMNFKVKKESISHLRKVLNFKKTN